MAGAEVVGEKSTFPFGLAVSVATDISGVVRSRRSLQLQAPHNPYEKSLSRRTEERVLRIVIHHCLSVP